MSTLAAAAVSGSFPNRRGYGTEPLPPDLEYKAAAPHAGVAAFKHRFGHRPGATVSSVASTVVSDGRTGSALSLEQAFGGGRDGFGYFRGTVESIDDSLDDDDGSVDTASVDTSLDGSLDGEGLGKRSPPPPAAPYRTGPYVGQSDFAVHRAVGAGAAGAVGAGAAGAAGACVGGVAGAVATRAGGGLATVGARNGRGYDEGSSISIPAMHRDYRAVHWNAVSADPRLTAPTAAATAAPAEATPAAAAAAAAPAAATAPAAAPAAAAALAEARSRYFRPMACAPAPLAAEGGRAAAAAAAEGAPTHMAGAWDAPPRGAPTGEAQPRPATAAGGAGGVQSFGASGGSRYFPGEATVAQSAGPEFPSYLAAVLTHLVSAAPPTPRTRVTRFDAVKPPEIGIAQYLARIERYFNCSSECFVLGLVYIDRLVKAHGAFNVSILNIHRLLITSVMLAAKYFDDVYYSNAFYARVGGVLTSEINLLEQHFLSLINYHLFVTPQEFEQYRRNVVSAVAKNVAPGGATARGPRSPFY